MAARGRELLNFLESPGNSPTKHLGVRGPRPLHALEGHAWVALDRAIKGLSPLSPGGAVRRWIAPRIPSMPTSARAASTPSWRLCPVVRSRSSMPACLCFPRRFLPSADPRIQGTLLPSKTPPARRFVYRYTSGKKWTAFPPAKACSSCAASGSDNCPLPGVATKHASLRPPSRHPQRTRPALRRILAHARRLSANFPQPSPHRSSTPPTTSPNRRTAKQRRDIRCR